MAYKNLHLLILALAVIYVQAAPERTETQNEDIGQMIEEAKELVQRISNADIGQMIEHVTGQIQRMTNAPLIPFIKDLSRAVGLRVCPFAVMSAMIEPFLCMGRKMLSGMMCLPTMMFKMFMCMMSSMISCAGKAFGGMMGSGGGGGMGSSLGAGTGGSAGSISLPTIGFGI